MLCLAVLAAAAGFHSRDLGIPDTLMALLALGAPAALAAALWLA